MEIAAILKKIAQVGSKLLQNMAKDQAVKQGEKLAKYSVFTIVTILVMVIMSIGTVIGIILLLVGVIFNPLAWFGSAFGDLIGDNGLSLSPTESLFPTHITEYYLDTVEQIKSDTEDKIQLDVTDLLAFDIVYYDILDLQKDDPISQGNTKKITKSHVQDLASYFYSVTEQEVTTDQTNDVSENDIDKYDVCKPQEHSKGTRLYDEYSLEPLNNDLFQFENIYKSGYNLGVNTRGSLDFDDEIGGGSLKPNPQYARVEVNYYDYRSNRKIAPTKNLYAPVNEITHIKAPYIKNYTIKGNSTIPVFVNQPNQLKKVNFYYDENIGRIKIYYLDAESEKELLPSETKTVAINETTSIFAQEIKDYNPRTEKINVRLTYPQQQKVIKIYYDKQKKYSCYNVTTELVYEQKTLTNIMPTLKKAYNLTDDEVDEILETKAFLSTLMAVNIDPNAQDGGGVLQPVIDGVFVNPVPKGYHYIVTSEYGYRPNVVPHDHQGIDLASYDSKTPIIATADGVVRIAKKDTSGAYGGGFGYYVIITHSIDGSTVESLYAHLESMPLVVAGQEVKQGQVIGYMGATGNVTGRHLHFEISNPYHASGSPHAIDPRLYINFNKQE